MTLLNETHDPARRSWVESANDPDGDFPIQNLPLGVFRTQGSTPRGGIAIGNQILDLAAANDLGLFEGAAAQAAAAAAGPTLNPLFELGNGAASALRRRLSELLRQGGPDDAHRARERLLVPQADAELMMPVRLTAFTDFSCSINHIGRLSGGNPWPALHHLPVAYNGRASSVRLSGTPVKRPLGQFSWPPGGAKQFGPEPALDFELELGAYLGGGNALSEPVGMAAAPDHLFGYALVNDWSARAILIFESALGPFLGKSFLTSVSPWIVTEEALAPFRIARPLRAGDQPPVPEHLDSPANRASGGFDIDLEAYLRTPRMRGDGEAALRIVRTNFRHMYWTFAQMIAHQGSNGCNLEAGDLIASGTASGPEDEARACLMEIAFPKGEPIRLPNGETRVWLQDGDELLIRGRAAREGFVGIGFGPCDGTVVAA